LRSRQQLISGTSGDHQQIWPETGEVRQVPPHVTGTGMGAATLFSRGLWRGARHWGLAESGPVSMTARAASGVLIDWRPAATRWRRRGRDGIMGQEMAEEVS